MATGRTVGQKYIRAYVDGYDLSGYARSVGDLNWSFDQNAFYAITDSVTGALPGRCNISVGEINGAMDNTDDGLHDAFAGGGDAVRDVMVPIGIRAAPAAGDPVFCAQVSQNSYNGELSDGILTVNLGLGSWDERGDTKDYPRPWGNLLHAKGAETAATTADAADHDHGAQTTAGGWMMYQVFSSNGTVAVKVQDADTESNASYSDLLSSGDVDASSAPVAGIKYLATDATVERYTRWQIALNTATTVTFALAFVRGV